MKVGDKFAVSIEGIEVAHAEVVVVRDGEIEVVIPGTRAVIATRTQLSTAPTSLEQNNSNREVVVTGVEREDGTTIDSASLAAPTVPVNAENNSSVQVTAENKETVTTESVAVTPETPAPVEND